MEEAVHNLGTSDMQADRHLYKQIVLGPRKMIVEIGERFDGSCILLLYISQRSQNLIYLHLSTDCYMNSSL